MTFPELHDIQLRVLRVCVRNAMFFATLPCYLAQETHPVPARSRRSSAPRHGQAPAGGPERQSGTEDSRWLR